MRNILDSVCRFKVLSYKSPAHQFIAWTGFCSPRANFPVCYHTAVGKCPAHQRSKQQKGRSRLESSQHQSNAQKYLLVFPGKSKEAEIKRINKELANIRSKFKGE